ncbi:MAG: motility associated factor glycosyltransferase family protein [Campylobacterota bacterium]
MEILQKNIAMLAAYNQGLAVALNDLKEKQLDYEVSIGDDPANINIIDTKSFTPLYEGIPLQQTQQMLNELKEYEKYPYLYFFGLGNGILFKLLLDNKNHKRIVVFEPDVQIVYIVLSLIDLSLELKEQRLVILTTDQMNLEQYYALLDNDAKIFAKTYNLQITNSFYAKNFHDQIMQINQNATRVLEHVVVSHGNDINDSLIGLENFLQNAPQVMQTPTLQELIDSVKTSQTVVLAATGPSLYKQLPLLHAIQNSVTIFSIDASFPILLQAGIKPDVVFSIERVEPTATFYTKVKEVFGTKAFENVTIALSSLVHERTKEVTVLDENLPQSCHPMLINRPLNYTKMFGLHEWGYMGRGMSAANMAFELTYHGGFDNVILIGQDLAYGKEGTSHSRGNVWGEDQIAQTDEKTVQTPAYGGSGTVATSRTWKLFLNFYEKDVADVKSLSPEVNLINATQGGARIAGMQEMDFEKAVLEFVDLTHRKNPLSVTQPSLALQKEGAKTLQDNVAALIKAGRKVLRKNKKVFIEVADECKHLERLNTKDRLNEIDFDYLAQLIAQIDTVKELTGQQPFNQFYMDLIAPFIISQELEMAKVQVASAATREDKKAKMVEWIFAHRYWLFALAGATESILSLLEQNHGPIKALKV